MLSLIQPHLYIILKSIYCFNSNQMRHSIDVWPHICLQMSSFSMISYSQLLTLCQLPLPCHFATALPPGHPASVASSRQLFSQTSDLTIQLMRSVNLTVWHNAPLNCCYEPSCLMSLWSTEWKPLRATYTVSVYLKSFSTVIFNLNSIFLLAMLINFSLEWKLLLGTPIKCS